MVFAYKIWFKNENSTVYIEFFRFPVEVIHFYYEK